MTAPAIETEGLCKSYGALAAVQDVSLRVAPGELFGLVGPDGAGKTTFLRTLAGLLRPTAGTVRIGGVDVSTDRDAVKRQIGYMSQRFSLSATLTVLENLLYVAEVWGVPAAVRPARIERLMQFSRLGPFKDRLARNLSGGMKQKLSLATCLIHQPHVLLLDEPTIGVDPLSRRDFWLILYDLLQEGSTILLSTPYMDEAERCGRVGFLLEGRLIACGAPPELKTDLGVVVLDLRCDNPRAAQWTLRHVPGFSNSVLFGDRVHVTLPRPGFDAEAALAGIAAAGVAVRHWTVREPSLEDVFLAYAHRRAGGREAA